MDFLFSFILSEKCRHVFHVAYISGPPFLEWKTNRRQSVNGKIKLWKLVDVQFFFFHYLHKKSSHWLASGVKEAFACLGFDLCSLGGEVWGSCNALFTSQLSDFQWNANVTMEWMLNIEASVANDFFWSWICSLKCRNWGVEMENELSAANLGGVNVASWIMIVFSINYHEMIICSTKGRRCWTLHWCDKRPNLSFDTLSRNTRLAASIEKSGTWGASENMFDFDLIAIKKALLGIPSRFDILLPMILLQVSSKVFLITPSRQVAVAVPRNLISAVVRLLIP